MQSRTRPRTHVQNWPALQHRAVPSLHRRPSPDNRIPSTRVKYVLLHSQPQEPPPHHVRGRLRTNRDRPRRRHDSVCAPTKSIRWRSATSAHDLSLFCVSQLSFEASRVYQAKGRAEARPLTAMDSLVAAAVLAVALLELQPRPAGTGIVPAHLLTGAALFHLRRAVAVAACGARLLQLFFLLAREFTLDLVDRRACPGRRFAHRRGPPRLLRRGALHMLWQRHGLAAMSIRFRQRLLRRA